MSDSIASHFEGNVGQFTGEAENYDKYRPQAPAVLVDILTQLAQMDRPRLVVDLASGTGLSTRMWANHAEQVLGIEPNEDMRRVAEIRTTARNIRYQNGSSMNTGLPDECADIVTVSQALHFMEPEPTFAEIARILKQGGVFAAIDCVYPPTCNWQAEQLAVNFMIRARLKGNELGIYKDLKRTDDLEHLKRIQASGRFRYTKEFAVHNVEQGNAGRMVGQMLTNTYLNRLLDHGLSEDEIGLTELRREMAHLLGDELRPWYYTHAVQVGIK